MDSINLSNNKLRKANAIKKRRQMQKVASFFRILEICVVLALVSRISIHLPVAIKNSSEYFKGLTILLVSPRFVFLLGNAIVITLFAKSGHFFGQDSSGNTSRSDLYDEFIEKSEKSQETYRHEVESREKQSNSVSGKVVVAARTTAKSKDYQRSLSENFEQVQIHGCCRELRRSATEKRDENAGSEDGWVKISYPEDNMSNEEFRSTVEAFIERQKRLRRDEECSV